MKKQIKKDFLLIKPHPGNLEIKKKLLIKRLKAENFKIQIMNLKKNKS